MTRQEITTLCLSSLSTFQCILLELATGFGKTKLSLDMVKHLLSTKFQSQPSVSLLLLVAKTVHKQTWQAEIKKWGGLPQSVTLTTECYESLKKHEGEHFNIIIMDEVHHVGSDARLESLNTLYSDYMIGLSATIPKKLKSYMQYEYHAQIVSCDVTQAIESEVLPEPQIILFPLQLDNTNPTECIEINPKAKGRVYQAPYNKLWTYRKMRVHALISCTERQKVNEYNSLIDYERKKYMLTRQEFLKNKWLFDCGERLKYLANLKNHIILPILHRLTHERTITFCKTIEQAETLGQYAIHSKNKDSNLIYKMFNDKRINHITSVNILNENANLVDCKYAIFANYSSSESIIPQRIGRALRHPSPVIIMPYYQSTREEEIVHQMLQGFSKDCIHTAHTFDELTKILSLA